MVNTSWAIAYVDLLFCFHLFFIFILDSFLARRWGVFRFKQAKAYQMGGSILFVMIGVVVNFFFRKPWRHSKKQEEETAVTTAAAGKPSASI